MQRLPDHPGGHHGEQPFPGSRPGRRLRRGDHVEGSRHGAVRQAGSGRIEPARQAAGDASRRSAAAAAGAMNANTGACQHDGRQFPHPGDARRGFILVALPPGQQRAGEQDRHQVAACRAGRRVHRACRGSDDPGQRDRHRGDPLPCRQVPSRQRARHPRYAWRPPGPGHGSCRPSWSSPGSPGILAGPPAAAACRGHAGGSARTSNQVTSPSGSRRYAHRAARSRTSRRPRPPSASVSSAPFTTGTDAPPASRTSTRALAGCRSP